MSKLVEEALAEFVRLGLKYPPNIVAPAAMQQAGLAYCFMQETVIEAIDAFRADIPKLEDHIRQVFGSVYELKEKRAATDAG